MNKHDCNDCYFYSALHGVCQRKGHDFEKHHGYDKACKDFVLDPLAEEVENE